MGVRARNSIIGGGFALLDIPTSYDISVKKEHVIS
jgi:hypothetical protein